LLTVEAVIASGDWPSFAVAFVNIAKANVVWPMPSCRTA
jgi:hypothetical protein